MTFLIRVIVSLFAIRLPCSQSDVRLSTKVSLLISHILAARKDDSFLFAHTNFDYKVNQF